MIESNIESLELYSDTHPFRLPLRIKSFENEADMKKFVKNCEKTIRGSLEYKLWRDYIIDVLGINSCMITKEKIDECTIVVHHHIPTLFLLIQAIVFKNIEKQIEFSTFDVCTETIELHYMNRVGYATLLQSMHEKFHNGFLTIPISFVKGDYKYFMNNLSQYIDPEDADTLYHKMTITEHNCSWARNSYAVGESS